jgi:hypothetical protein
VARKDLSEPDHRSRLPHSQGPFPFPPSAFTMASRTRAI